MLSIKFKKSRNDAVVPSRANPNDVGYDLTALELVKKYGNNTYMYDTGICIQAPENYYTEIVPRSSISKTGYILSNSVGVIDPDFRGSLKICLTKVDPEAADLVCPFVKCQLLIRKANYATFEEVQTLTDTVRGDGEFGSSDKK